ncbi:Armadillo-type fold [Cynara cardunculus var. scolymus]|uniref:Armadillo-type fold n=1 Tax=Cynara cardunculus var. scolymus TaxID=59895 RepID=A0A103XB10_CYNCS|nr:Armadillo-type fold [Cynara cardunculus var. scolymus]
MVMLDTDELVKKVAKPEENSNGKTTGYKKLVDTVKKSLKKENVSTLYEALLDGVEKGFAKHVFKKKNYLVVVVVEGEDSVEELCGKAKANAVKEMPHIQKALYDVDILEKEYVVKWYEDGCSGGYKSSLIWKNAKPFLEWLQSVESKSEEKD